MIFLLLQYLVFHCSYYMYACILCDFRKELEMERLMGLQKESQTDERIACQSRIVEIDREMEAAE